MEVEDTEISQTAAGAPESEENEAVMGSDVPQTASPVPSTPADTGSASADPSQFTGAEEQPAGSLDVLPQGSKKPQPVDFAISEAQPVEAAVSEAVLSAQSQQSIQADISEILAPSRSMVLLHDQHQVAGTTVSQPDLQLIEPVNPTQQDVQSAEADISDAAQASTNEAPVRTDADSTATEQAPIQDATSPSGLQQEESAASFAHATFVVPTENWKHLQMVPLVTTAAEIKHSLCSNWNIAETALSVKYNKQDIQDSQSLASCGIQARLSCSYLHIATLRPYVPSNVKILL